MRLLWVAGGRDYSHIPVMREALRPYFDDGWSLITGAQRGADLTAETIWRGWEGPYQGIPARWSVRGRGAGPEQNMRIARDYKPDLLLHFPGGRGTASAIEWAEKFDVDTAASVTPPGDTEQ
jgi:hypothetical protein